MIASVARDSGRAVKDVGADSYALTLWAFLHGKDAQHLDSLIREAERIDLADNIAVAFHDPQSLAKVKTRFRSKLTVSVGPATREELSEEADELWQLHERGKRLLH